MLLLFAMLSWMDVPHARAQSSMFLPMLYTTPNPVGTPAYTMTQFVMNLCKNSMYDGKSMEVAVNMPDRPWNISGGYYVNIAIYNNADGTGTPIGVNQDSSGTPIPKFSLVYNASWGDLYVRSTTAASPNILYTLSISFDNNTTSSRKSRGGRRSQTTGVIKNYEGKTITGGGDPIILDQIVNDFQPLQVMTGDSILVNFSYCPADNVLDYDITVSATAVDDISATALAVCVKPSEMPCTPNSAQQENSDPSGTALNSVYLSTTTQQYSQLQAVVVGWGEYNQLNSFLFTVRVSNKGNVFLKS